MVLSSVLGFPRIGAQRELKKTTEAYWAGKVDIAELERVGKDLRAQNWAKQQAAGVDIIPSNDFSYYDHILDLSLSLNIVAERYSKYNLSTIDTTFAMGRGLQREGVDVPANEMVKWFDSNYHYVRPTFSHSTAFKLNNTKAVDEYLEAKAQGIETRPVLIGPVSLLFLGKADKDSQDLEPISLLEKLLPIYADYLAKIAAAGAASVQIDEPILVLDLPENVQAAFKTAYEFLANYQATLPKITIASYFGDARPNLAAIKGLPVAGFHYDFVRVPEQLEEVAAALTPEQTLSVGIVDGRNVWKADFAKALKIVEAAKAKIGADRVVVATSSSLLHTPVTLENEIKLNPEIKDWLSFATQKLDEVVIIAKAATHGVESVAAEFAANAASIAARASSSITNDPAVRQRVESITADQIKRKSAFATRLEEQKKNLNLPSFPTTTIGSFPQTKEIRINRNKFTKGEITAAEYEKFIEQEIAEVVKFQEEVGLDVLVHGEPERNDMVQYFGERLKGFVFTQNGWVQSYGSRYVRPPIIVGDVSRPAPMTVKESKFAQSLTSKPMKGMLTGPVTCLRWSFPRNDISPKQQAQQLALALRDEVNDLEAAGIYVIQVDEPAIREGLPLRAGAERDDYVKYAVESFRLSTSGVEDKTQIHSHFCYSDLDPAHIKALDADVVSIEFSKKDDNKYIEEFSNYPNHIGLGVFDIHSPRVPSQEELEAKIQSIVGVYPKENLWVNPDCGLKTRKWDETKKQLTNMVNAAKIYREKYSS
ncbi:5-methyltetrahydropteroyltriglutamate--homocysteine methyltransferase [Nadsonia fulvescens var. elongata DSM 6958]|uniref:5-methyltetrahydropteroyltriglutamate--homocysteine S-methyltransferase n=1 Tax=Nadsonia fulvescens var. elongata DSM 6958 TaxID=857566 RepID=A0A1E3PHL9_9ASCO|nr:5-methyltetrahydropteroyltriglutamate--homocysteine methyltransferase [Nadsonia fulvescens var. elongata DSM 6958]